MDKRKPLSCAAVFDIETEDWTKFVMGGIRSKDGYAHFDDEDAMVDALLEIDGRVWAHNLGRFDGLWLLDVFKRRGLKVEIVNAAARVVSCKVGETEFADSLALVPMSLAEWTGEKESTGLPCVCPSDCGCSKGCLVSHNCGGYCSIRRDMGGRQRKALRDYLRQDCEILWTYLASLESFAADHDLDLGLTIGGSSWSTVQRRLGLPKADWRGTTFQGMWKGVTYEGIRDGYFGGRTQVFRPKLPLGYLADVNSMYPYQLSRVPMPVGEPRDSYRPSEDYGRGRAGVFLAHVVVPDMPIPPLPVRTHDRIAYPIGEFQGVWTGLELRWAEARGVKVKTIARGCVWDREEVLFDTWMKSLFSLRMKAGKKTSQGKWLKLFANSLTGKFAMRPARARYRFNPEEREIKPWDALRCKKYCGNAKKCRGKCGAGIETSPGIWKTETYFVNPCAHVEWAAHLTAGARTTIGDHLYDAEKLAYTDTDSIFAGHHAPKTGKELGDLEDKGPIRNFECLAPKVYSYEELVNEEGKTVAEGWRHGDKIPTGFKWTSVYAAKGISTPEARWARIVAGETVESGRIRGFVTGAKKGEFFKRDQIKRTVKLAIAREGAYGDRVLKGEKTFPQNISKFRRD